MQLLKMKFYYCLKQNNTEKETLHLVSKRRFLKEWNALINLAFNFVSWLPLSSGWYTQEIYKYLKEGLLHKTKIKIQNMWYLT